MKKVLIVVLAMAVCSPLWANEWQLPPGKWWENQRLVEHLQLTGEQQEQIRGLVYEHAMRMIDLKAAVDRSGLVLREIVVQATFAPDEVRKAFTAFQNARRELESERFELLLAVRQVLTSEQWLQLQRVHQEMQRRRQEGDGLQRRPMGRTPREGQRPPL
jgi:Spy/CpxP family protein refolding chaperone